jgi:DNA-binding CsgD family transcriptional regulator
MSALAMLSTSASSLDDDVLLQAAVEPRQQAWVVDACGYGREGLVQLARQAGATGVQAVTRLSLLPGQMAREWDEVGLCVVRLPAEPAPLCHELRTLLSLLPALPPAIQVVVLVPCGLRWVVVTLLRGLENLLCPPAVGVFSSRLALPSLTAVLEARLRGQTLCGELSRPAGVSLRRGLSIPELEALSAYLHGTSVPALARRRAVSAKTVYNQRRTALYKLGAQTTHGVWRLLAQAYRRPPVAVRAWARAQGARAGMPATEGEP